MWAPTSEKSLLDHPEQGFADQAAVALEIVRVEEAVTGRVAGPQAQRAGGQAEGERGAQTQGARLQRVHGGQHRPHHEQGAGGEQGDGREVGHGSEEEQHPVGHRRPYLASPPSEIEHAGEEGRATDQGEPDQVLVALLERGKLQGRPQPARAPAGTATCSGPAAGHG